MVSFIALLDRHSYSIYPTYGGLRTFLINRPFGSLWTTVHLPHAECRLGVGWWSAKRLTTVRPGYQTRPASQELAASTPYGVLDWRVIFSAPLGLRAAAEARAREKQKEKKNQQMRARGEKAIKTNNKGRVALAPAFSFLIDFLSFTMRVLVCSI